MPRNVEQLFGLCRVVSPLRFFKQFDATTTARLCARLVLRPLVRGSRIYLQEDAPQNALHIVLEGNLNQGPWTLQAGDTFGYRVRQVETYLRPNATIYRCILAVSDCLIAYLDRSEVTNILNTENSPKFAMVCFQPELAMFLLRSKPGSRSLEEDMIVLSLVAPLKFMTSLSADMRSASARLMRLSSISAGHPAFCGTNFPHQLFVVLAGAVSVSVPENGTSFVSSTNQELEASTLSERCVLLRPGDSYPPRVSETLTSNRRQNQTLCQNFKSPQKPGDFSRNEMTLTAETHAEVLTLRLDTLMATDFPSELPYSLEHCRRFLKTHPTKRTAIDVRSFSTALLKFLPFFLQLPTSTCESLASRMELLCLDANETLTLQPSENYCVVLLNGTMTFEDNQISPGDMIGRDKLLRPWLGGYGSLRTVKACELAILQERYYQSVYSGRLNLFPDTCEASRNIAMPDLKSPIMLDASLDDSIVLTVLGLHKCEGASSSATLAALPRCLRLRLVKACTIERRGAYVDLGPLVDLFAVVVRGSISIHCSFTRLVDDDYYFEERTPGQRSIEIPRRQHDDTECFIRPIFRRTIPDCTQSMETTQKPHKQKMIRDRSESPSTNTTTTLERLASLSDHESFDMRRLWRQLELGECCAVVAEGGEVGSTHPDQTSATSIDPGEAKLAHMVTREPTTFVRVNVSASTLHSSTETTTQGRVVKNLMKDLTRRNTNLESKPAVELVLEVLCLEPCLAALPPRLRLHLARSAMIQTVQQHAEPASTQSQKNRDDECCFVLKGTLEVLALFNKPVLLDRRLTQRTGILQGRTRVGDLVPGDMFGGEHVLKLAVAIAETYRDAMMRRNGDRLSPELAAQDAFSATDSAFAAVSALAAQNSSKSMPSVEGGSQPSEEIKLNGGIAHSPIGTFATPPVVFKCASQAKLLMLGVEELLESLAVMSRENAAHLKKKSIPQPPTESRLIAPFERAEFYSLRKIEGYNQDHNRPEVTLSDKSIWSLHCSNITTARQTNNSTSTSPVHKLFSNSDNDDISIATFATESTITNTEWDDITRGLPLPTQSWRLSVSKMSLPRRPETIRAASARKEAMRIRKLINPTPTLMSLSHGRQIHRAKMFYRDFPREVTNRLLEQPVGDLYSKLVTSSGHNKYTPGCVIKCQPDSSNNPVSKTTISTPHGSLCAHSSRAKTAQISKARFHKHVLLSASGDSAILRALIPVPPAHSRNLSSEGPWKHRASTGERAFFKAASGRIRPLHLLADRADWAVEGAIRNMRGTF